MEIKLNSGLDALARAGAVSPKPKAAASQSSGLSFEETQALNESLLATPDIRSEAVTRGKELVSSAAYPPPEAIQRIANLLAMNLSSEAID
ncbi:MAG: hypothetical protein SFY81_06510 [Verrucomicrobiota bacterium]|nr:hypothetical protein [Verrucomicrobiota bacterium]